MPGMFTTRDHHGPIVHEAAPSMTVEEWVRAERDRVLGQDLDARWKAGALSELDGLVALIEEGIVR